MEVTVPFFVFFNSDLFDDFERKGGKKGQGDSCALEFNF